MHAQYIPHHSQLRARLDRICTGYIHRYDVQRSCGFGGEALEGGGGEGVSTGGKDDVGGGGDELADEFETEATTTAKVRVMVVSVIFQGLDR